MSAWEEIRRYPAEEAGYEYVVRRGTTYDGRPKTERVKVRAATTWRDRLYEEEQGAKSHGAVATCRICGEAGAEFCADYVECNYRSRIRIGIPAWQARRWRARDLRTYPRANGGRR